MRVVGQYWIRGCLTKIGKQRMLMRVSGGGRQNTHECSSWALKANVTLPTKEGELDSTERRHMGGAEVLPTNIEREVMTNESPSFFELQDILYRATRYKKKKSQPDAAQFVEDIKTMFRAVRVLRDNVDSLMMELKKW